MKNTVLSRIEAREAVGDATMVHDVAAFVGFEIRQCYWDSARSTVWGVYEGGRKVQLCSDQLTEVAGKLFDALVRHRKRDDSLAGRCLDIPMFLAKL